MKLPVGLFVTLFAAISSASILKDPKKAFFAHDDSEIAIAPAITKPTRLFEYAQDYQGQIIKKQSEIDSAMSKTFLEDLPKLLGDYASKTLDQIEANSVKFLERDEPVRAAINSIDPKTPCVNHLKLLIDTITEFTGYGSGNCVAAYKRNFEETVAELNNYVDGFGISYRIQQIVVDSFAGKNVFTNNAEIFAEFKKNFHDKISRWNNGQMELKALANEVEKFYLSKHEKQLEECFEALQTQVIPSYDLLKASISTCTT